MLTVLEPRALWLLLALFPIAGAWLVMRRRRGVALPSLRALHGLPRSWRTRARPVLLVLRLLVVALAVVALARPQSPAGLVRETASTIDVFVVLDVSSSMGSEDFQPNNRLEVAKRVISDFVRRRPADRIGLLTFARFSTLSCPLTLDHAVLLNRLAEAEMADGDDDGTAIGMALASAVNHIRSSPARSRAVVLLTDGENNRSTIDPSTGASVARAFGVTVYTIGVGRVANEPAAASDDARAVRPRSVLNESALDEIATATGGKYFRAADVAALEAIFGEIDTLERTELPIARVATGRERFVPFALAALALALLELVARTGPLRRLG